MRTKKKFVMGVIGFGRMGTAIATGSILKDYLDRYNICAYDPEEVQKNRIVSEGFTLCESVAEAAANSHILLLACPRSVLPEILPQLKGIEIPCILSIIKGVTSSYFQEYLPGVPVIRALINTPLKIYEGSTAMSMSPEVKADDYDFCFRMFRRMGKVCTVPETKLDIVQVMHATAPAYICCYTKAMHEKKEEYGIDEDAARTLLVQGLIGTARLLQENRTASLEEVLALLCDNDPPSIAALQMMEEANMNDTIREIARKTHEIIHNEEL